MGPIRSFFFFKKFCRQKPHFDKPRCKQFVNFAPFKVYIVVQKQIFVDYAQKPEKIFCCFCILITALKYSIMIIPFNGGFNAFNIQKTSYLIMSGTDVKLLFC